MHTWITLTVTLLAMLAMWVLGYAAGYVTAHRRADRRVDDAYESAKQILADDLEQPATLVPDTPAQLDADISCDCGRDHDQPIPQPVSRSADLLVDITKTVLQTTGALTTSGAAEYAPAAVVVLVPIDGDQALAVEVGDPAAYPDIAVFADDLERFAGRVRARQGQINADIAALNTRNQ